MSKGRTATEPRRSKNNGKGAAGGEAPRPVSPSACSSASPRWRSSAASSRTTVRLWQAAGLLQTVELPFGMRRNLYRRADVEAFLARLEGGRGHGG